MQGAWYSLRKTGTFDRNEKIQFFVTCAFIAFAFFWNFWREADVNLIVGILWFLAFFIAAVFFLGIHVFAQKLKGAQMGYKVTYGYWIPGLLLGFLLSILSVGSLIIFVPGTIDAIRVERMTIGKFRGRFSFVNLNTISIFGLFVNMAIVIILKPLYFATGQVKGSFPYYLILMTLLILLYSLIPYPHSIGMNMFKAMRWSIFWALGMALSYSLLIFFADIFSYVLAFIIGIVVLILYHMLFEEH